MKAKLEMYFDNFIRNHKERNCMSLKPYKKEQASRPNNVKFILPICKTKVGTDGKRERPYGYLSLPDPLSTT